MNTWENPTSHHRAFNLEEVSRLGIYTPSFKPVLSVHSTAILWAPLSEEMPSISGMPLGLIFFKRIRQIPTMALPSTSFGGRAWAIVWKLPLRLPGC